MWVMLLLTLAAVSIYLYIYLYLYILELENGDNSKPDEPENMETATNDVENSENAGDEAAARTDSPTESTPDGRQSGDN